MELDRDICPTCKGDGEVRGAWAVTYWQMVPCERCDGAGDVPALKVEDIIFDSVVKTIFRMGETEASSIATELTNELIDRGIFILRERDLQEVRSDAIANFSASLQAFEQQRAEVQTKDEEECRRLAGVLREQAEAREKLVPGSPIAVDLRSAADLIDRASICPTCKSPKKDEAGNPDGLSDIDAPIHCDDSWHLS